MHWRALRPGRWWPRAATRDESGALLWPSIALAIGSVLPILGMPLLVGAMVDHWGFSASIAGYVTSVDLAGLFLGSVVTASVTRAFGRSTRVTAAVVICALSNLLCAFWHPLPALFALRFIAGVTAGMTYAYSLTLLARFPDAARGFALMVFWQVVANAVVIAVFPVIGSRFGPPGLFLTLALLLLGTLPAIFAVPQLRDREADTAPVLAALGDDGRQGSRGAAALCIGAVACVYVAIGCYWAYAERMGLAAGLTAPTVHTLLTAGVLLSTAACAAALRLARSFGQSRPLLSTLGVLTVLLLINAAHNDALMYVLTVVAFQACWNFIDIYQLGTLAEVEPSGRAVALVPAAQGLALAIGPAAGALALDLAHSYAAVLAVAAAAAALAALCYAIVYASRRCT
ncbi:MAG: hypothetical protein JSR67_08215 [Proteobacteria bacterium]|nr:hypothetical protein [Pseudomonadota bacterium]